MNPTQPGWQFKDILLVYSSKGLSILEKTAQVAEFNRARLTIIDIAEDFENQMGLLPPTISEKDAKESIESERRSIIEEQAGLLGIDRNSFEIRIRFGTPVVEIIREVVKSGHDLVVKTAAGGTGLTERLFGSTGMQLLRKNPCPVWIAKPQDIIGFKRIVAAIDPLPSSHLSDELSHRILQTASAMARIDDGHIDILHCWHLPGEATFSSGRTKISTEEFNRIWKLAEKVHRHKAMHTIEKMKWNDVSHQLHLIHGKPADSILKFAEKHKSELIVLGTTGKSGLSGMLMGNTAETIVKKTKTSVLVIKTENFVSPVNPQ